jgi:signal transduction histidine kinase
MIQPKHLLQDILTAVDELTARVPLNAQQKPFVTHIRQTAERLHAQTSDLPPTEYAMWRIVPALGDDLKQAVTGLYGYARMLLDHPAQFGGATIPDAQRPPLETIYERGITLAQLIDRLHQQAFDQRKAQRTAKAVHFDLNMLIWQNIPVYRYWLRDDAIKLTTDFPNGLPPIVGRPYHIAALVQHVVVFTAQTFMAYGDVKISANYDATARVVRLRIFFMGLTITPEIRATLFERSGREMYQQQMDAQGIRWATEHDPGYGSSLVFAFPIRAAR